MDMTVFWMLRRVVRQKLKYVSEVFTASVIRARCVVIYAADH
jgi:hypothetical protein